MLNKIKEWKILPLPLSPLPHPSLSPSLFEVSSRFLLAHLCKNHPGKHLLSPWDSCSTMYGGFLFPNAWTINVIKPGSEAPAIWPLPILLKLLPCHQLAHSLLSALSSFYQPEADITLHN